MFKRVTKRAKRREQAEQLGVADKMQGISSMEDTDSDESDSDEGSSDEGQSGEPAGPKRNLGGDEEDDITGVTDEEVSDEEDTTGLSSMTVKQALKASIEDNSCILCPGKNLKNTQMEHVHLQSQHHQRRLKRFEALVERLSSQFEDVYSDQAALVVRLLGKPSIGQNDAANVRGPEEQSKRAIKKKRLAAKKEKSKRKRKRKRDALDAQDEEKGNPVKRRKPSHSARLAKGKASSP